MGGGGRQAFLHSFFWALICRRDALRKLHRPDVIRNCFLPRQPVLLCCRQSARAGSHVAPATMNPTTRHVQRFQMTGHGRDEVARIDRQFDPRFSHELQVFQHRVCVRVGREFRDRGRKDRLSSAPRFPNRTGGFPPSGSPVSRFLWIGRNGHGGRSGSRSYAL